MIELYLRARMALESLHPLAPWGALSLAIWALVYSVRRWLPKLWLRLELIVPSELGTPATNILLGLPSVAFGAAWAAFTSGEISPSVAFYGAISGALAPIIHHVLKAVPVPYRGAVRDAAWKLLRKAGIGSLLLLAVGCSASSASYELCRADARARFHRDADRCPDEACIDALSKIEESDLRACR